MRLCQPGCEAVDDGRDRRADDHGHLSASDTDAGVDDLDHHCSHEDQPHGSDV